MPELDERLLAARSAALLSGKQVLHFIPGGSDRCARCGTSRADAIGLDESWSFTMNYIERGEAYFYMCPDAPGKVPE